MRNDSMLYTGGSGQTPVERRRQKREEQKVERETRRNALSPHEEDLMALLDKEVADMHLAMLKYISPTTPEKDVQNILASLSLHEDLVKKFKVKLQNTLRGKVKQA